MNNEDRDSEHLRLLRIGHYVGAGLAVAGMGVLGVHYLFMRTMLTKAQEQAAERGTGSGMEQTFGDVLPWFYVAIGVYLVAFVVLNLISAMCIAKRRARMFSLVVAGLNCTHMPLGTALGVLTILVLSRDSVRASYKS